MANNTYPFSNGSTSFVGKEGYSVKGDGAGALALSANSALAVGVIRVGRAAGGVSDVALPGEVAPVLLSGTVYAGDLLAIDSNSKFAASTPSDGDILGAIALEDGVAGDLIDALICKATRHEAG
jgi:hypothetical protein